MRYRMSVAKSYTKKDGSNGTKWIEIGSVTEYDGKMFGEQLSLPVGFEWDGSFQLFPIEEKNQNNQGQQNQGYQAPQPQYQDQNGQNQSQQQHQQHQQNYQQN